MFLGHRHRPCRHNSSENDRIHNSYRVSITNQQQWKKKNSFYFLARYFFFEMKTDLWETAGSHAVTFDLNVKSLTADQSPFLQHCESSDWSKSNAYDARLDRPKLQLHNIISAITFC